MRSPEGALVFKLVGSRMISLQFSKVYLSTVLLVKFGASALLISTPEHCIFSAFELTYWIGGRSYCPLGSGFCISYINQHYSIGISNTGVPNSTPSGVRSAGSDEGAAFGGSDSGASLFPGLDGSSGFFGSGLPEFEQVQQQLLQNPNLMREIMNMPLAQNPDILWNFVLNNPHMREIIDRNPELAHKLNDPSTLRQTRMYENVQEPFLNATTMAGDARSDLDSNPFAVLMGTRGGGQGTDQSTNPSRSGSDTTANSPAPNINPLPNPWASGGAGSAQTNSTTGSNPHGDDRLPATGGLGGLGLPEFGSMLGSTQDIASLSKLMQNPDVSQMMQSLLSNPQSMNQVFGLNPQLCDVLDSNSQLREMMQNPQFIHQLTSPETMQQLLTLRQALRSQLGQQLSSRVCAAVLPIAGALDNMGLEMLMNMFSGLGIGITTPNQSNVPPEVLYATSSHSYKKWVSSIPERIYSH
ncbi:ubiquitin family protein [Actinidia rufa]|uniref:Ubiquitin family protein n=1 Tax=Actinidia rufa TaxID=165716 RepID=A0A7J0DIA8_9ERIC|nr:ubiquitin family protein [Actinidia rufa]